MRLLILISFIFLFSGCLFDGGDTHLTGEYEIGWIDLECSRTIYYGPIGQMKGYVYDVNWNDNFILAKRHPGCSDDTTDYFIIDIKKNSTGCYDCLTGVFGPLSEVEFTTMKNSLNIPDKLEYHKNFK